MSLRDEMTRSHDENLTNPDLLQARTDFLSPSRAGGQVPQWRCAGAGEARAPGHRQGRWQQKRQAFRKGRSSSAGSASVCRLASACLLSRARAPAAGCLPTARTHLLAPPTCQCDSPAGCQQSRARGWMMCGRSARQCLRLARSPAPPPA